MNLEQLVFIPPWVETAVSRSNLTLEACLDYSKIRPILSLEDMSGFLALQDIGKLTGEESDYNGTLLSSWQESAGAQISELTNAIVPLSHSNEPSEELIQRLSLDTEYVNNSDPQNTFYRTVDLGRGKAAFVVYPGYFEYIKKPENQYKVVVDQLKLFYVYLKPYQVAGLSLFTRYLKLLSNRINTPAAA